jgi:hypothetical protein
MQQLTESRVTREQAELVILQMEQLRLSSTHFAHTSESPEASMSGTTDEDGEILDLSDSDFQGEASAYDNDSDDDLYPWNYESE